MPDDDPNKLYLRRDEIQRLVAEEIAASVPTTVDLDKVVRTAVDETLIRLGVDAKRPLDLQQDMAFLRDMRAAHQKVKTKGILVLVGLVVSTFAALIWLGLKASLHN